MLNMLLYDLDWIYNEDSFGCWTRYRNLSFLIYDGSMISFADLENYDAKLLTALFYGKTGSFLFFNIKSLL